MSDVMLAATADAKITHPKAVEEILTLKPSAFAGSEFAYGRFSATLPVGWPLEAALKPEFWVHIASRFSKDTFTGDPDKAGAIIELRSVDHAFYAQVYVRAVQERGLVVSLIGEPIYFGPKKVEATGYEASWNVGKRGYDIIRKSDRSIVADGSKIKTKEQAQAWIDQA